MTFLAGMDTSLASGSGPVWIGGNPKELWRNPILWKGLHLNHVVTYLVDPCVSVPWMHNALNGFLVSMFALFFDGTKG